MTLASSSLVRRAAAAASAAALFALLAPTTARAEDGGRLTLFGHHYSVLAGVVMGVPRDATTRAIYGQRTFVPMVTLWNFETPRGLGLSWDLGGRRFSQGDRRAEYLQGGVGPRILFTGNHADFAPYLAVRGDAYVLRLDQASWRTKPGANVEVGASVMRHAVVSARYDLVPKIGGVDLSGFSARLAVKVF